MVFEQSQIVTKIPTKVAKKKKNLSDIFLGAGTGLIPKQILKSKGKNFRQMPVPFWKRAFYQKFLPNLSAQSQYSI